MSKCKDPTNELYVPLFPSLMLKENLTNRIKNGSEWTKTSSAIDSHEAIMTPASPVLKHVKTYLVSVWRRGRRGMYLSPGTCGTPGKADRAKKLILLVSLQFLWGLEALTTQFHLFKQVIHIEHEHFYSYCCNTTACWIVSISSIEKIKAFAL